MSHAANTFVRIDDAALIKTIGEARRRLVFIAPGVRKRVAEALAQAIELVPAHAVYLVIDADAEVCRLGYGSISGLELLQRATTERGVTLNHHAGIRIGLLIADETTVIYSPIPLLIEDGSNQHGSPNAILLQTELAGHLAGGWGMGTDERAELAAGNEPVDDQAVEAIKLDLQERPPKKFNVARIERVFNSHLHYVEFKIKNYQLTTRSLLLDPELFGVKNQDVIRRLTNRYHLFAGTDSLTVGIPAFKDDGAADAEKPKEKFGPLSVDRERKRIKTRYVIEAGKFGSLILRRNVQDFEKEVTVLKAKLQAYKKAVQSELKTRTDEIVSELLKALTARLQNEPPDHWHSRYLGDKLTAEDVKRLFGEDVRGEVERVTSDFNPEIFTAYKDVTYDTFKDPKFREVMEKSFGKDAVARVFSEHDAAPEQTGRDDEEM